MMKFIFPIILLLSIAMVAAAELDSYQNIVVVGKDAPASDVVIGANFAASMKATSDATFTSALDADAYGQLSDLDGKTIVVINGAQSSVKVIGSGDLADTASTYFRQQGFEVRRITSPQRADLLVGATIDDTNAPQPTDQEAPIIAKPVNQTPIRPPEDREGQQDNQNNQNSDQIGTEQNNRENQGNTSNQTTLTVEPKKPNVVVRIWRWFAGLF